MTCSFAGAVERRYRSGGRTKSGACPECCAQADGHCCTLNRYLTQGCKMGRFSLQWDKHIDMEQHCIRLERKQTKTNTNTSCGLYMTGEFLEGDVKGERSPRP